MYGYFSVYIYDSAHYSIKLPSLDTVAYVCLETLDFCAYHSYIHVVQGIIYYILHAFYFVGVNWLQTFFFENLYS